ncbi:D-inositol-3-phosphate glycosyltransferase [Candidatus Magnetaquicoccaceae bacterium FCR-1]|uniref:D-inositol-3-phosphate glycosyltransferase n=1 Tax=Candidatus Magnetaquiglobus chichijimensis TaxID=3141448 RepID=A0ABQ0C5N0_9PROT
MIPLTRLVDPLVQELRGRLRRRVHYVSDSANWSYRWDAHYIATGLESRLGDVVPIITAPWRLRHQVILFGNRAVWFAGPRDRLHPSNALFLTWFHGEPDSGEPKMDEMFARMPGIFDRMRKVVVSCVISRQVLMAHGVPGEKIELIPLGVDLTRFRPADAETRARLRAALEIPREAFVIGSFQKDGIGWGDGEEPKPVKGPDLFLELLEQLRGRHPNVLVMLTGPARGYVKRGLERLGIPYRHRFLENYLDIVSCYQILDLYAITSRAEGGPKALMESWACGVPVVSSRMGMPADWILDGRNGFLSDVGDTARMAGQVGRLLEDPALLATIRDGGLETVQGLDWDRIAGQYHAMLRECDVI